MLSRSRLGSIPPAGTPSQRRLSRKRGFIACNFAVLATLSCSSERDFSPPSDSTGEGTGNTADKTPPSDGGGETASASDPTSEHSTSTEAGTATVSSEPDPETTEAPTGPETASETSVMTSSAEPPITTTSDEPNPSSTTDSDSTSAPVLTCGDAQHQNGETCDDGNADPGDGCDADCQVEAGHECLEFGSACRAVVCGDGILAQSEGCDDGNADSQDGCPDDCSEAEPGFACTIAGEDCVNIQMCGDGQKQGDEECDLGNDNSDTGDCTSACQYPKCGDGHQQTGEQCDDGRLSGAYGGCAEGCLLAPHCGDGKLQSGMEACDDGEGNTGAYGGCTESCQLAPFCGDGVVDVDHDEDCDDGDDIEVNGCGPSCRFTSGLSVWYKFEEGSGSTVTNAVSTERNALVEYGRRWDKDVPFTEAFVMPEDSTNGYIHLQPSSGLVDPTDEAVTSPIQYVDLGLVKPNPSHASLSVWARRTSKSTQTGLLLWMGSGGDGQGGSEVIDDLWLPQHEIWMRYEGPDEDQLTYSFSLGFTPSHAVDITQPIPEPDPMPESVKCRSAVHPTYGDWHHFVLTLKNVQNPDGAGLIRPVAEYVAFLDGQRVGGATECYTINMDLFRTSLLGRAEYKSNSTSWRGDIDNFMMYSRELTDQEVSDLYNSQKP